MSKKKKAAVSQQPVINESYELVATDRLQPHPRNVNRGDLVAIGSSIAENGFYGAVVAQKSTGHILAGNHRYDAAKAAGIAEVPVTWVDVDDDRALRILLADNRTTRLGHDDQEALAALLQEILDDTQSLAGTGFDETSLDQLLTELQSPSEEADENQSEDDNEDPVKREIPEDIKPLFERAWTLIASEWQHVGTPEFCWLSPELTPGVAAWHFIDTKYCGGRYFRKFSLAFTPNQIRTAGDNAGSSIDLLQKIAAGDSRLLKNFRFALKDEPKTTNFFTSSAPMAGHKIPLDFPADLARDLYEIYCPTGGAILDPCHGWGGRCVGFFLADGPSNYVGCDPSPTVHAGVKRIISTLGPFSERHKSAILNALPFEEFETDQVFDFALTSPPYFDREKYDGEESSFRRYQTFDGWVEGFYGPLIQKVFRLLRPGAAFALQVGSQIYPLQELAKEIASECGFVLENTQSAVIKKSPISETEDDKSESLILFRKPN